MTLRGNEQAAGAIVRRAFRSGDTVVPPNTILSAAELAAMPISNRRCLASAGNIDVFPIVFDDAGHDLFLMHIGHGRFDVIEGRRLNVEPLTKDEARALLAERRSPGAPAEGDEIAA